MLIILDPAYKSRTAIEIDRVVSAEIPDPGESEQARRLHEIVINTMIHHECGRAHPNAACMEQGRCSKGFPKPFAEETEWRDDRLYPAYRRRSAADGGQEVMHRGRLITNQWVVPYSPFLSLRYACHINVELCCSVESVKYLFKYIYKGHDRQMVRTDTVEAEREERNEITEYQDLRSIGASEACWRLFEFDMSDRSPAVQPLQIHLENLQMVYFEEGQEVQAGGAAPRTPLTAWMQYNRENAAADPPSRNILYGDFPRHYTWDSTRKRWNKRKIQRKAVTIGRVVSVSPRHGEVFYLRILLHHVPGAKCYEDLRTVNGVVCQSNQEACRRRGLLQHDGEWEVALQEATHTRMPASIRQLFATILLFCAPAEPLHLLEGHLRAMTEDILHGNPDMDPDLARSMVLLDLERRLQHAGKELRDFGLPGVSERHRELAAQLEEAAELRRLPPVLQEELDYDIQQLRDQAADRLPTLLPSQREMADAVLEAVRRHAPLAVFVDAPGGTGKTYTFNAILSAVRAERRVALAVAYSGIAATLLDGGRTFHSRFKAPLSPLPTSMCAISAQSPLADLIRRAELIVWDEAPMAHRYLLEALDRTLRDVTQNNEPFGGKVVLLGGDFRQTLPVIRYDSLYYICYVPTFFQHNCYVSTFHPLF